MDTSAGNTRRSSCRETSRGSDTATMNQRNDFANKREQGLVLLMTMFILMLFGVIAVDAIGQSGMESAASGRSRSTIRTMHAADAGTEVAVSRLRQTPPDVKPISITVAGRSVQSRMRTVVGAQNLDFVGVGKAPEGYSVNIGESYVTEGYDVTITAASLDGSVAEVETKITRLASGEAY